MTKKYGVIGYPIGHTMSPFIQKELFSQRGISADYGKYQISPEKLGEEFEKTLKKLDGFNITIPHKVSIIRFCDELDASAKEYGAVNLVVNENGKYIGYNTDAYGFLKGLEFSGIALCGKVLVYGFGGAARTIIAEALKSGCEVTVGTTDELKAQAEPIVREISEMHGKPIKLITNGELCERYQLLVNATPVGMYPNADASPLTEEQLDLFDSVYDIVYNPVETKLVKTAKAKGKVCGGGLSMLVAQAQKAHTIFYGASFSDEETAAVIEKTAKELEAIFSK